MHQEVLARLPVQAGPQTRGAVNSLDPRAKRFRAADRSLHQARQALQGARIALVDLPRSNLSPVTAALDSLDHALSHIAAAAAQIDEARLADDEM
jgi:hypothetical protein